MNAEDREFSLSNIGERIAEARERAGLTRRQVGQLAGVDQYRMRSWEETLTRPTVGQLEQIAEGCGVTADWLVGRDLIEESLEEQALDSFVCLAGRSLDRLRLVDLEKMREAVVGVMRMKRQGWHPAVVVYPPESFTVLDSPGPA